MTLKRIFCFVLSVVLGVIMCVNLAACSNTQSTESDNVSATVEDTLAATKKITMATLPTEDILGKPDVVKYSIQKYMYPIWKSDTSFAETAFVREGADGKVAPISLLYPIKDIVSVRSFDLQTLYTEGVDYRIDSNGDLEILEDGNIPVLAYDNYYFPSYAGENSGQIQAADDSGGAYIFSETKNDSKGMSEWALAVTYHHAETKAVTAPVGKSEKFERLISKLENQEEITVAVYGDSISYGWAASGHVNRAPGCPSYIDLVCKYITQNYGVYAGKTSFAVSGTTSSWGAQRDNLKAVYESQADLIIIAFGMNDGVGTSTEVYVNNINYMVNTIKSRSPESCVVVVSSMLPNAEVGYSAGTSLLNYHLDYAEALREAEKGWTNAALADVTAMHVEMLERKAYQDTSSSNVNHPNDYMHRVYAQVIFQTIFGDYGDY